MTVSDGLDRPGQNNQSHHINQTQRSTGTTSPVNPPNDSQLPEQLFNYPPLPARYMPNAYDPLNLLFDGQPHSLARYLHDIELLGRDCGMRSEDLIWYAIQYLDSGEAKKWSAQASTAEGDWAKFKAGIMLLYPGSDDHDPYTATYLDLLVRDYAAVPMHNLLHYDEYYRRFTAIADWHLYQGFISQRKCSKLFLAGFHVNVRNLGEAHLDQSHTPSELWTVREIDQAARYILQRASDQASVTFPTVTSQPNTQPSYTYPQPSEPFQPAHLIQTAQPALSFQPSLVTPGIRESVDTSSLQQLLTSDTFLDKLADKLVEKLAPASLVPWKLYFSQLNQPQYTPPSTTCRACSDPTHYIRYCPKVIDYILRGRCIKDQNNRICLPDGTLVTTRLAPGKDILERVDNWHQAHAATSASTTSIP